MDSVTQYKLSSTLDDVQWNLYEEEGQTKVEEKYLTHLYVLSQAVLFAYLNILTRNTVPNILPKKLYCDLKSSFQCNQENNEQNFVP